MPPRIATIQGAIISIIKIILYSFFLNTLFNVLLLPLVIYLRMLFCIFKTGSGISVTFTFLLCYNIFYYRIWRKISRMVWNNSFKPLLSTNRTIFHLYLSRVKYIALASANKSISPTHITSAHIPYNPQFHLQDYIFRLRRPHYYINHPVPTQVMPSPSVL